MKGTDQCLDVCDTVSTDSGANYSMCLLAYAGYHAQKDILQFLIQKDAGILTLYHVDVVLVIGMDMVPSIMGL